MQLCIGTSLAIIVPTVLRSYRAHRAREAVLSEVLRAWAVPAVIGVAVGSVLAAFAPPVLFKAAFAAIAGLIAAKLLFGRESWVLGSDLPGRRAMIAYGFAIGLGSSLMGIAGGSLVTMVLTLYRMPIHRAVATVGRASACRSRSPARSATRWRGCAPGRVAAAVGRLCLGDRAGDDRAGVELGGAARGAARLSPAAALAGGRVRAVPADRRGALRRECAAAGDAVRRRAPML